jgi:hypothetical protein
MTLTTSIAFLGHCQSDSVKCYNKTELQAIVLKLIEGKECKELFELCKKENQVLTEQKSEFVSIVKDLEETNQKLDKKLIKENKRKKIWRGLTIGAGGLIAVLTLIISI